MVLVKDFLVCPFYFCNSKDRAIQNSNLYHRPLKWILNDKRGLNIIAFKVFFVIFFTKMYENYTEYTKSFGLTKKITMHFSWLYI